MCVPVCKFSVTGVGKRSHLSVPALVLLLARLSVSKWRCFEQHFIPCPLLSCSGLSAPIWRLFEKMSVSLLLSYLGIALIKLFGELLPSLLVFGLLQQVPEMSDLPLQQRLQVGLCLLQLHQDLIVGVVLHLFLLWLQDPWHMQQRCSSCFIPFKVLLGSHPPVHCPALGEKHPGKLLTTAEPVMKDQRPRAWDSGPKLNQVSWALGTLTDKTSSNHRLSVFSFVSLLLVCLWNKHPFAVWKRVCPDLFYILHCFVLIVQNKRAGSGKGGSFIAFWKTTKTKQQKTLIMTRIPLQPEWSH